MAAPADFRGLTTAEAAERLRRLGPNELPAADHHSLLVIAIEVIREPMFALLLGAAVLYAAIGDLAEAIVLGAFATVSVSIAVVQRGRSERVLEKLKDLSSPRALVLRDGARKRIAGREVVPGDLLVVTEGDRVAADGLLLEASDIRVDESLLTGESVPVRKVAARERETSAGAPGGDDLPQLFSGTLVLRGTGLARVTATGPASEMGKIGRAVTAIETEQPRLGRETRRIVVVFAWVGLFISAFAVLLYGLLRGAWIEGLLGGIALGMSMLPEEFPLVLTVFMVMGAWRLSRSRVLTRRATAIETLGAATVLCTDKTGTLTRNSMSVVALECGADRWRDDDDTDPIAGSQPLSTLVRVAVLASDHRALDPMERALQAIAERARVTMPERRLVKAYPLRSEFLAVTQVWTLPGEAAGHIAAKGAPEAILRLTALDEARRRAVLERVDELARKGVRVLAVAQGRCALTQLPDEPTELLLELVGLVGLADPLRESVPAAVSECRAAGIRVVMITGDYPQTARAIAGAAGIDDGALLTGADVDALDEAALKRSVSAATVFARIRPNQKLRIVEALKSNGEVVAMTGDGVNDAPALKAAHIGIAMGGRGTDVAREAASLVLLDDDFGSIVQAIRQGRRIYDNLRKAFAYILAIHIPIAGLALLPIVRGEQLLMTPMLIALLELIIDPACSVVLEAESEESNIMRRPPRDPRSPLISRLLAAWSVFQGLAALAVAALVYVIATHRALPAAEVRAFSFVALIGVNVVLIFSTRTFGGSILASFTRANASLTWGLSLVAVVLTLVLAWPNLRSFFGLGPIAMTDLLFCAAAAAGLLALLSGVRWIWGARLAV
ncbi:MAG TPA: cation-translocating P-type ATPase [Steroidobacteraceae bacterium]